MVLAEGLWGLGAWVRVLGVPPQEPDQELNWGPSAPGYYWVLLWGTMGILLGTTGVLLGYYWGTTGAVLRQYWCSTKGSIGALLGQY